MEFFGKKFTVDFQKTKANELRDELLKEGFFVSEPNTSITNFGVSTYIGFYDNYGIYRKFRISDHSVTNIDRIFNEYHYNENTNFKILIENLKSDIEETKENVRLRLDIQKKDDDRTEKANQKWESLKHLFIGLCFKKNDRTYQNLDTFSKNRNRSNIYQKALTNNRYGETPFYYEWTEPQNPLELCREKPSREFIEQFSDETNAPTKKNSTMPNNATTPNNENNTDIKDLIAQVKKSAHEELNFCNSDTTPLVCQMISTAEGREKIVDLIVEYVGTNGMSISEAIVAIENERNSNINEIG